MMNNLAILPYAYRSESAIALQRALGCRRASLKTAKENPDVSILNEVEYVINWGCNQLPPIVSALGLPVCNHPDAVLNVSDKVKYFTKWSHIIANNDFDVIAYFSFEELRQYYYFNGTGTFFARTLTRSNSGRGIVLVHNLEDLMSKRSELSDCQLFVKKFDKTHEYRVHFFNGEIIDHTRKARRRSVPDDQVNWEIRSHGNGFVFVRESGAPLPDKVREVVQYALDNGAFDLDFSAMDVLYCSRTNRAFICEVNTAPGIEGTTIQRYADAFRKVLTPYEA